MDRVGRLLVVGGGGARGAWSGGVVKRLRYTEHKQPYRYAFGTSTGSPMAPLIVLDKFGPLETAYTSVNQGDIFSVNPFTAAGQLRGLNAAWRFLLHKNSFGDSTKLLTMIKKYFTAEDFRQMNDRGSGIEFTVACIDFTTGGVVYQSSAQAGLTYEDMCNWIWASSNEPLFMTFVPIGKDNYVDGGVRANVPVVRALKAAKAYGIQDIDVIVSKPVDPIINKSFKPDGILNNLLRVIELWETEVRNSNIEIAELLAKLGEVDLPSPGLAAGESQAINLHFYYIPRALFEACPNDLIFNEAQMKQFWADGENGQQDRPPRQLTILHKHIDLL
jgi:predicted acylesterase/phospholipase RssA